MRLAIGGPGGGYLGKKREEFLAGMARASLADDFPGPRIQRRVQGKRSVAAGFEAVLFGAARRQGQAAVEPIQGLNGALLTGAEDGGVLRRVQIQAMIAAAFCSNCGSVEAV